MSDWALLIDLGNSQLKWAWQHPLHGLFVAPPLPSAPEKREAFWDALAAQPLGGLALTPLAGQLAGQKPRQILLANTRGGEEEAGFVQQLLDNIGIPVQGIETPATAFGLRVAYTDAARLGVDRWLGMLAATDCFPK